MGWATCRISAILDGRRCLRDPTALGGGRIIKKQNRQSLDASDRGARHRCAQVLCLYHASDGPQHWTLSRAELPPRIALARPLQSHGHDMFFKVSSAAMIQCSSAPGGLISLPMVVS